VKVKLNLIFICVSALLLSCSNKDVIPVVEMESKPVVPVVYVQATPEITEIKDCQSTTLSLSSEACTVLAWQVYVQNIMMLDAAQRKAALLNLGSDDVDQLKRVFLLSHPEEDLLIKEESNRQLFNTARVTPSSLSNFITLIATYNERTLQQERNEKLTERKIKILSAEKRVLADKLALSQKKIQAITDIEQQLNSEGLGANE